MGALGHTLLAPSIQINLKPRTAEVCDGSHKLSDVARG
jgi:hypothetical protein